MIAEKGCLALAAMLLAGCAGSIPFRVEPQAGNVVEPTAPPTAGTRDIFRGVPGKYRELAGSAEKAGDLRRALLYRKIVHGFAPEDADARESVERIQRKIRDQVDRHYRAALALEGNGETAKALREFLAVLVLDPDHKAAFRRVKNGTYGKSEKPDVDTVPSKSAEKVPGVFHPGKEGNDLRNAAQRKEDAERKIREADAHYAAGLRRFLAEDLDGAIREWGKALALDPAHPKARRDIEKARRLKGKIESPK
jgi:tetratricopeptide (TPR) repeat protein